MSEEAKRMFKILDMADEETKEKEEDYTKKEEKEESCKLDEKTMEAAKKGAKISADCFKDLKTLSNESGVSMIPILMAHIDSMKLSLKKEILFDMLDDMDFDDLKNLDL